MDRVMDIDEKIGLLSQLKEEFESSLESMKKKTL